MNQRNRLAVRQRSLRLSFARLVVDLPEVVPDKKRLVQIRPGSYSFDRVPVLDEGLEFDDLEGGIFLLEVDYADRQRVGAGYRVFDDDRESEQIVLLLVVGQHR